MNIILPNDTNIKAETGQKYNFDNGNIIIEIIKLTKSYWKIDFRTKGIDYNVIFNEAWKKLTIKYWKYIKNNYNTNRLGIITELFDNIQEEIRQYKLGLGQQLKDKLEPKSPHFITKDGIEYYKGEEVLCWNKTQKDIYYGIIGETRIEGNRTYENMKKGIRGNSMDISSFVKGNWNLKKISSGEIGQFYTIKDLKTKYGEDWQVKTELRDQGDIDIFKTIEGKIFTDKNNILDTILGYKDNGGLYNSFVKPTDYYIIGDNQIEETNSLLDNICKTENIGIGEKDLTFELKKIQGELDSKIREISLLKNNITDLKSNIDKQVEQAKEQGKQDYIRAEKQKIANRTTVISKDRAEAWENIIIGDLDYKTLQVAFDKKFPLLLKGPSGVGKTSMIRALAKEKGIELMEFDFNSQTTVENLLGHKVLVGTNNSKDAPMVFEYGPLADAVKNGKIFLGNELNASSTGVQFIFNGLLEAKNGELGSLAIQGNNGEVIKAHPNFRFYGTYNPGYLGTSSFGMSLMSRFASVDIKPLDKTSEINLLLKSFPKLKKEIDILVELEHRLRNNKNFTYDISTRDLDMILNYIECEFSIKDAVKQIVGNNCQLDLDLEELNNTLDNILNNN